MGKAEWLQHLESTRMVAPTSVSHGAEKPGRLYPKFKKHRVSCARDFPPGCGPFAHLDNSKPVQEVPSFAKIYPQRKVEAVREYPPLCGINAFLNLSEEKSVMGNEPVSSSTAEEVQPTTEKKRPREDPFGFSHQTNQLHGKAPHSSEHASHRVLVLGLMTASNNQLHRKDFKGLKTISHRVAASNSQLRGEDFKSSKVASHREIVLGLMAASHSLCVKGRKLTRVKQMMYKISNLDFELTDALPSSSLSQ